MGNDATLILAFTLLFVVIGFVLPFFNTTFDTDYEGGVSDELQENQADSVNAWRVITSILTGFIWGTGWPVLLNLFFLPIRVTFFFVIARNIWIGGGGIK